TGQNERIHHAGNHLREQLGQHHPEFGPLQVRDDLIETEPQHRQREQRSSQTVQLDRSIPHRVRLLPASGTTILPRPPAGCNPPPESPHIIPPLELPFPQAPLPETGYPSVTPFVKE